MSDDPILSYVDLEEVMACRAELDAEIERRRSTAHDAEPPLQSPPDERNIADLGLSKRAYNALYWAGIARLEDLLSTSLGGLRCVGGIGKLSVQNVVERLATVGLSLTGRR
jgi:DNA-directed RNA polymerase alpha subunit